MAVRKTKKGAALKRWFKRTGKMSALARLVGVKKEKNGGHHIADQQNV